jgi:16S rRNA (cytidine1402-2'-O)-methyltransferase
LSGRLFIVSTPIGNLGDISPRVKEALNQSQLVLAEDTRVTQKILFHLGIKPRLVSCHEFNHKQRLKLLEEIAQSGGTVSLASDAGTPLISDPGYQIVRRAIELGMAVVPIPGPSAVLAALVGSGFPGDRFAFEGFLPERSGERRRRLERLRTDDRTLIFYVAPSNMESVLSDVGQILGDRPACLARELTKLHEEFIRDSVAGLLEHIRTSSVRGEYVLVVEAAQESVERAGQEVVEARLRDLLSGGARVKDAALILAGETGWTSSQIYKLGLAVKEGKDTQA